MRELLQADWIFGTILIFSLLFFLYKGISYAVIGSFVPLLLILLVLLILVRGLRKSESALRKAVKLWALLLMVWSGVRVMLSLVNSFIKPIPEGHVADQLGLLGLVLSLLFLFGAIYLWKNSSRLLTALFSLE